MSISNDADKSTWQNPSYFYDKNTDQIKNKKNYINIIKAYMGNTELTSDSVVKTEGFSFKTRNKIRMTILPPLFNILLKF